jgi:ATP-binding cassette subfamily A (ABC1) protein 3
MYSLYYVDYPDNWGDYTESEMIKLKYVGCDCLYMGIEVIVYLVFLVILENVKIVCKCCFSSELIKPIINQNEDNRNNDNNNISNNQNDYIIGVENETNLNDVKDSIVLKEIEKANKENIEELNYAIIVQNLIKNFKKRVFCNTEKTITKAVRNLSFCLEYGECFGFLGVNGAGKTTTFKCLSNEYTPSYGRILIDNKELNTNFNTIRSLIGYCPQFDSIFEYMSL